VTSAKMIIHNYYRNYINVVNFTALKTTPYYGAPTSTIKSVYTESGPSGTQIGQYTGTSTTDSTHQTIEVPLDSAAAGAINNILGGSPKNYSFGVGMHVNKLHPGYTYGNLRWTDIR